MAADCTWLEVKSWMFHMQTGPPEEAPRGHAAAFVPVGKPIDDAQIVLVQPSGEDADEAGGPRVVEVGEVGEVGGSDPRMRRPCLTLGPDGALRASAWGSPGRKDVARQTK